MAPPRRSDALVNGRDTGSPDRAAIARCSEFAERRPLTHRARPPAVGVPVTGCREKVSTVQPPGFPALRATREPRLHCRRAWPGTVRPMAAALGRLRLHGPRFGSGTDDACGRFIAASRSLSSASQKRIRSPHPSSAAMRSICACTSPVSPENSMSERPECWT